LYRKYSTVNLDKVFLTDIKTASLTKYMMNSFYALKVTYMNQMYDVANQLNVEWSDVTAILAEHPWMGTHHFQVPGPDGQRGFGGPCLPKDTEALVKEFDVEILKTVLKLNNKYRT
jgi:UDPglucose 6-dehydrogenase